MDDLLYEPQGELGEEHLMRYAAGLGLELRRFEEDLVNDDHAWRIEEDRLGGDRAGVGGTPALFVNGVRYTGPIDLEMGCWQQSRRQPAAPARHSAKGVGPKELAHWLSC
jgi:protein-disulfide isomerase